MSNENPLKRAYNSNRRKEQARQTRLQILEAARSLFVSLGYSGATMDAIAGEAGVAVDTVYAVFGNKRAVLSALVGVSLVGDDEPVPLLLREGPRSAMQEKDRVRQIELFAAGMTEIMGRMAPLFEVMRAAAKTEPDIAMMLQRLLAERVDGMKAFITALQSNGPLQEGLSRQDAAETVWTITSGEVYTLLVTDRGWSVDKYRRWLTAALIRLILPVGSPMNSKRQQN